MTAKFILTLFSRVCCLRLSIIFSTKDDRDVTKMYLLYKDVVYLKNQYGVRQA